MRGIKTKLTALAVSQLLTLGVYASTPPTDAEPSITQDDSCEQSNKALETVQQDKSKTEQDCTHTELNPAEKKAAEGELKALESVEKKLEEERLKVLFVDVNTVMERVGTTMDWTANWLDAYFADDESGKNFAKTWGHVTFGWEPRDGEWGNFPMKFKVRAKLPNLKNKVELILTDNEQDDFKTLPYETVRPDAYKSSQKSLGAAVRFLHAKSENLRASSRLGWGEDQLYARTSVTYRKKMLNKALTFTAQPALEYYVSDGWGARFLVGGGYAFNLDHELRIDYSLRDLESFESPEWRAGMYHIGAIGEKSAVIIGVSSVGVVEPEYTPEFHKFSVRFRRQAIRKWIFIEAEPFVEFSRSREMDAITGLESYTSYERDVGIAIRFEGHYGFH